MNKKIFVCCQKYLYTFNSLNGSEITKVEFGNKFIGTATGFFINNDKIIGEIKEDVASFTKSAVKNNAVSTDKNQFSEFEGDALNVWTGKDYDDLNQFIRFDLKVKEGKILGSLKDCCNPRFNMTGNFFLKYDKDKVIKYMIK